MYTLLRNPTNLQNCKQYCNQNMEVIVKIEITHGFQTHMSLFHIHAHFTLAPALSLSPDLCWFVLHFCNLSFQEWSATAIVPYENNGILILEKKKVFALYMYFFKFHVSANVFLLHFIKIFVLNRFWGGES